MHMIRLTAFKPIGTTDSRATAPVTKTLQPVKAYTRRAENTVHSVSWRREQASGYDITAPRNVANDVKGSDSVDILDTAIHHGCPNFMTG